jgi:hypothetical protein
MAYATIASALRTHLESLTLSPVMPLVWQNDEFKPETDGGEAGWLYSEILLNGDQQASFGDPDGGNIFRDTGLFVVNIVVPRGSLIGRAEAIADSIRAHFKSESVTGVHFTNRWIGASRLNEQDSRWFVLPVLMEFWADRIETPA